jgi:hypothetical protein
MIGGDQLTDPWLPFPASIYVVTKGAVDPRPRKDFKNMIAATKAKANATSKPNAGALLRGTVCCRLLRG